MSTIESILSETRVFEPSQKTLRRAAIPSMDAYRALCAEAEADYEGFWGRLANELIDWHKPFTQVLDESQAPFYRWFADGELNVTYNCLDRHLAKRGDKTALIFESDGGDVRTVTYKALYHEVCRLANGLKKLNLDVGDRVVIYMPMGVEVITAMLACARLGLVHSVVFGGFSAKSIGDRIQNTGARAVIAADGQMRGGRSMPLKPAVDEALGMPGCETVEHVVVFRRTGIDIQWNDNNIWWHDLIAGVADECDPVWVNAEHPLFLLYTSGSTGKPKGVQHASAGFLLQAANTTRWVFDARDDDVFWCTADVGWVTGHSYVTYGPLALGLTQVVFEGVPTYPDASRFWQMIERHKVSIFYTAPTAIRALIRAATIDPKTDPGNFDLSSLRLLGSVGEPINPEAWVWYYEKVGGGRCPVLDTYWQTETGSHMITPLPVTPLVPGSCTLPLPGILAAVVDESGAELPWGTTGGMLVIKKPWPSMIRDVWGDHGRYQRTYFPDFLGGKVYLAGDGAVRDPRTGYFTVMGRIDDVLNVSGHRLGTMEIESALVASPLVAEAAIVGRPHDVKGEAIVAYVVLKSGRPEGAAARQVVEELRAWVAKEIGAIAKPDEIHFGDNLPKTRSGKIMRRLLRTLAKGEEITSDVSTLENPAILEQFKQIIE